MLCSLMLLSGCGSTNNDSSSSSTAGDSSSSSSSSTSSSESSNDTSDTSSDDTSSGSHTQPGGSDGPGGSGGPDGGGSSGGGGGSSSSVTYGAANEFSSDATESNGTYSSTNDDESAVLVNNGASVTLTNPTITKTGNTSSADNSNFYGQNASLLAMDSATCYVKGGTVTSDSSAEGGAGLYAYDTGTVYASDTVISTQDDCAGGLHVAGGGTMYAWDITATTQGEHSAAIRSDRGGGTMVVDGGAYTSNGTGSPAVYSTATIAINEATLISNGSEGASIEGKNSIDLFDCSLTGNMSSSSANSDETGHAWGVILYQSGSGDSEEGTSEFAMVGGSIDIQNGGFFYSTNTGSEWYFEDATFNHTGNDDFPYLFRATGSSKWGDGTGPEMKMTFSNQEGEGTLIYDSASQVDFCLTDSSTWTGSAEISTTYTGNLETSIYIDSTSKWVVTESCTIDNLYLAGSLVDSSGNTVSVSNGSRVLKSGTSSITVTVTGDYSTSYSSTSEVAAPTFPSVSKPSVLA